MKNASLKLLPVGYPVYHAISQLNRSFEDCIENLNHVMSFKLFNADHLRTYEVMVEEARALINQEFGEVINHREFQNSAFFEDLRLRWLRALERDSGTTVAHTPAKVVPSEKQPPRRSKNQRKKTVRR